MFLITEFMERGCQRLYSDDPLSINEKEFLRISIKLVVKGFTESLLSTVRHLIY